MSLLDGKKYKHAEIYKSLEEDMKEHGCYKSGSQMQIKFKRKYEDSF